MSKTFADFSLHESLQQALEGLNFTTPTPVQEQSIPAALEGKDLLVSSQTGSAFYRLYTDYKRQNLSRFTQKTAKVD